MADILHIIEPEMRTSPPRAVKTSFKTRVLIICGIIIFTAIFAGGLVALWEAARLEYLAITGKTVYAHITTVDPIGKGKGTEQSIRYRIVYSFDHPFPHNALPQSNVSVIEVPLNSQPTKIYKNKAQPKPVDISPIKLGMQIPFRYGVVFGTPLTHPWTQQMALKIAFFNLMGGVLVAVSVIFIRKIRKWQDRRLNLLRYGNAVAGSIVERRFDSIEGKYYLKYKFFAEPNTPSYEFEEQCTDEQWRRFKDEEPVTVLYDPQNHMLSGLYLLLAEG